MKYYDGEQRASGSQVSGWKYYEGSNFNSGVGYEIAAKPRVSGRPIAIVRFPFGNEALSSGEPVKAGVTVRNYGYDAFEDGDQTANNVGWNLVGNQYMSSRKKSGSTDWGHSFMQTGSLQEDKPNGEDWNGSYTWKEEAVRYVTTFNMFTQEYTQTSSANCEIQPYQTFFIQVKTDNSTFTMDKNSRIAKAPAHLRGQIEEEPRETMVEVLMHSDNATDNAGLLIGDKFSEEYEVGNDLAKVYGDNQMALYTVADNYELAFNALNETLAGNAIPLGFTAPEEGEYIITLNEQFDLREVESVLLTDYETGAEIDLLAEDYYFDTKAAKNNNERFVLRVRMRKLDDIGTDINGVYGSGLLDDIRILNSSTGITLRGVPENASVYVYDMTGKLISLINGANGDMSLNGVTRKLELNGLPVGVYNIRVQTAAEGRTLRVMVK